jgi:hypothetical protein
MIKVYTGLKGFAVFLFFMAGMVLFLSIFSWGIAKAAQLLLPLLTVLAYMLVAIFVLGVLPASLFKNVRPSMGTYSALMSHVLGVLTWMVAFFFVIRSFGFLGIFLVFLFQFLGPLAIVEALLKGAWVFAADMAVWISFIYGMRYYSQWLLNLSPFDPGQKHIIDVDIVEVGKN